MTPNPSLQPTGHGVAPIPVGGGLRQLFAGRAGSRDPPPRWQSQGAKSPGNPATITAHRARTTGAVVMRQFLRVAKGWG
jgi:hypothetical protein